MKYHHRCMMPAAPPIKIYALQMQIRAGCKSRVAHCCGKPRRAVWKKPKKTLKKRASDGLATPSLEIDLAASYFERDSRAEHPNLQRTLNLLSEVLSKPNLSKDDQASALFNLAIAYEKTQAWDLAVETWEKYLQVDSSSGWAGEARQRLAAAKEKSSNMHRQSYSDPVFFCNKKPRAV